ncbi:hypothetical protein CHELA40_50257 [Chelatococcus asaccharovorans]|nr:hypothetical protein CHELA17_20221 [Chelatococcus asaccharovorans]CAH1691977.1 hypothetical protein CHELA40_50257 [Chelatococcus asaccharovorans]
MAAMAERPSPLRAHLLLCHTKEQGRRHFKLKTNEISCIIQIDGICPHRQAGGKRR